MQEPSTLTLPTPASRYLVATRPGFLMAAVIPVLIGLAAAGLQTSINWLDASLTLLGAVAAHAGINVLNDVYDERAGCDAINNDRLFPFTGGSRVIQNGVLSESRMAAFGWILMTVAAAIGIVLTSRSGTGLLLIGLIGLSIGWSYSAPPLRLSARGLGELSVGLGFGLLIPLGTAYVQLGHTDIASLWAGLPFAFLITSVLYVNQFPDLRADIAGGKRNLVVRLGVQRARPGYLVLLIGAYLSLLMAIVVGGLPVWMTAALLVLPLHVQAAATFWENADKPNGLRPAVEATLNGTMLMGLLSATGIAAVHWL